MVRMMYGLKWIILLKKRAILKNSTSLIVEQINQVATKIGAEIDDL